MTAEAAPVTEAPAEESSERVPESPVLEEVSRIDPEPDGPLTLSTGLQVELLPFKMRQLFKLLRIATRGARYALASIRFDVPEEELVAQFSAVVVLAIPEAEEETLDFIRAVVHPVGPVEPPRPGHDPRESAKALRQRFLVEMENPEPDDVLTIIGAVFRREVPHLKAWGKRLMDLLKMARVTGEIPPGESKPPGSTSAP